VSVVDANTTIILEDAHAAVFYVNDLGVQGPPGPAGIQGPAGSNVVLSYPCQTAVSGHRMVRLNAQAQVLYASAEVAGDANLLLGMTTHAAVEGASVSVQRFGEFTEPSWSWTPNAPIYLAADGHLTQTPPEAPTFKFSLVVGFAIAPTKAFIDIREPIILS
jgi:hypothetical protein